MFKKAAVALIFIAGAGLSAMAETPPTALKPYLVDGTLLPGDFAWLRGDFADASPKDKGEWSAIKTWLDADTIERTEVMRAKLRAMGVEPASIEARPYGDQAAALIVVAADTAKDFKSWSDFQAALTEAEPAFEGYLAAMEAAELTFARSGQTLQDKLNAAVVSDQVARDGISWARLNKPTDQPCLPFKLPEPAGCSHLSDAAAKIFVVLIRGEAKKRDHADTALLKDVLAQKGWPTISQAGEIAAHDAWLLAQHADDDPAFQWLALQLMEPLVAKKEVSGEDYAYLKDRVSLTITGKQRYGTQTECRDGHYAPMPLEEPEHLDTARKSVGLDPFDKNQACD